MFDLVNLIKTFGLAGIFFVVFAESGLFIGFFLPGDSLLFTAGFLASQGFLNIYILALGSFIAAVAGDSAGYYFGKKIGPAIFNREDSLFFNKEYLQRAKDFYEKHGGKTIVLARFMPFIRTFAPIVAGVGQMRYGNFLFFNIFGGFAWAVGVTFLGYFLGNTIPNVDHYILPILAAIIIISVLPGIWHILRNKNTRQKLWALLAKRKKQNGQSR